jgi:hypothetical protein
METITTGITNLPTAQSWEVIDVEASLGTYSPTVTRTLIIYSHVLPNLQKGGVEDHGRPGRSVSIKDFTQDFT